MHPDLEDLRSVPRNLVHLDLPALADADDDLLARVEIYEWMGMLLGDLVDTAMGTLPD